MKYFKYFNKNVSDINVKLFRSCSYYLSIVYETALHYGLRIADKIIRIINWKILG